MSEYHDSLQAVQLALWEDGFEATPALLKGLANLDQSSLPDGVSRLPGACMAPGPHLEAQDDLDLPRGVVRFEPRAVGEVAPEHVPVMHPLPLL